MTIVRQYRVRPIQPQLVKMKEWIGALRWQCNYRLAERFKWWEQNRCKIGGDDTSSCAIAPLKNSPDYYSQKRHFKKTDQFFPSYKNIFHLLQNCVEQVAIPQYNRKAQKQIERLQPQLYRHQGSKHRVKIPLELAPVKLDPQRQDFRPQTANWLLKQLMVVVDKDLNTKKLAPSKLTKFVTGATEEQFLSIRALSSAVESNLPFGCLSAVGENCLSGREHPVFANIRPQARSLDARRTKPANATANIKPVHHPGFVCSPLTLVVGHFYKNGMLRSGINQEGFGCDAEFFKSQADRWYFCPNCGLDLARDDSAVRNVKKKAVGILSGQIGREKKAPVEEASHFWKNARRLKSRLLRLSLRWHAGLVGGASRQQSLWVYMPNWDAALVETKNPKITRKVEQGDMSPNIGLSRPLSNFV